MTLKFYEAICGPGTQPWTSVDERRGSCGVGAERFEVDVRVVTFPVGTGATVLRATTTVWLPGTPAQQVFNYLCDGDRRTEWDIGANRTSTIRQEGCFSTGEVHGNSASLLRTIVSPVGYSASFILIFCCCYSIEILQRLIARKLCSCVVSQTSNGPQKISSNSHRLPTEHTAS